MLHIHQVAKQLGMNEQLCEFLKQRFVLFCFKELKITEKKFVAHDEINVLGQHGIWLNKNEIKNWKGSIPLNNYLINEDNNPNLIINLIF